MKKNLIRLSPNIKKVITRIFKKNYTDKKGLTLIEILITTLLMAMLGAMLIFVFRSGQTTWSKSKSRLEIYQNAQVALEGISRELAGALISDDNTIYFLGAADRVDFVCSIESDKSNKYDLCEVRYYLNTGDKELMKRLERNPDFNLSGGGSSSDLAFQVTALLFKYWEETTTDWDSALTAWNSGAGQTQEGKLPEAIKISVTIEEDVSEEPITKTFETVVKCQQS